MQDDTCSHEKARLIRERTLHADAERRTWSFSVQVIFALTLFALAPLVPGAKHLFGAFSVARGFALMAPAQVAILVTLAIHRRVGSSARTYRIAESVESFLLYLNNVVVPFMTEMPWTVVWILCPFTAVFWAITKPFERLLYRSIIGLAHALVVVAYVLRGDAHGAWIAAGVGLGAVLTFEFIAREGRRDVVLEAERNVAQTRLNEALLDEERRRVACALREGLGRELQELASGLDRDGVGPANAEVVALADRTGSELWSRLAEPGRPEAPVGLRDLARRIDDKCLPLCIGVAYESSLSLGSGAPAEAVGGDCARAIVCIVQEFVRNAIVHGEARAIKVALSREDETLILHVVDDGVGLSPERFDGATGGLDNALQWVREHGGTLELVETERTRGTALRAMLPGERLRPDLTAA